MKMLLAGDCAEENIFRLVDPTGFVEIDFEAEVVKALTCLLPDYWCGVFAGSFVLEGERRNADLALVHKSLSHWFVVEVELIGHSLEQHVLPQVRNFRYGEPDATCLTSLLRAFDGILRHDHVVALLRDIPRYVAVVANLADADWIGALRGVDVQLLTVSVYRTNSGRVAYEVDGRLVARNESLGFARYSEIDQCMRIRNTCGLPTGSVQFVDQFGNPALWTIRENSGVLWISKDHGHALFAHESYIQIVRSIDGRLLLRPSSR
jgi:hypothetical protein